MADGNTVWDSAGVGAGQAEPGTTDTNVRALHQGGLRGLRQHGGQVRSSAEGVCLRPVDADAGG